MQVALYFVSREEGNGMDAVVCRLETNFLQIFDAWFGSHFLSTTTTGTLILLYCTYAYVQLNVKLWLEFCTVVLGFQINMMHTTQNTIGRPY
jgi:hypothetical protein